MRLSGGKRQLINAGINSYLIFLFPDYLCFLRHVLSACTRISTGFNAETSA
jgi:hypothetical protein